jgi:hypothetical protein
MRSADPPLHFLSSLFDGLIASGRVTRLMGLQPAEARGRTNA